MDYVRAFWAGPLGLVTAVAMPAALLIAVWPELLGWLALLSWPLLLTLL